MSTVSFDSDMLNIRKIKIGSTVINKIYLGAREISTAYIGENIIFKSSVDTTG
jgi:hypothetical protein